MELRLGKDGQRVLYKANLKASARKQPLTTLHLLLAFCEDQSIASLILEKEGIGTEWVNSCLRRGSTEDGSVFDKLNEEAQNLAKAVGSSRVEGLHLLAGVVRVEDSLAFRFLTLGGYKPASIYSRVVGFLTGTGRRSSYLHPVSLSPNELSSDFSNHVRGNPGSKKTKGSSTEGGENQIDLRFHRNVGAKGADSAAPCRSGQPQNSANPFHGCGKHRTLGPKGAGRERRTSCVNWMLDSYRFPVLTKVCENLNELACRGQIDEVLGRGKELECLMDILGRRKANNPVLIGDSGVGKTAIVEGLALNIVRGRVDERFRSKIILKVITSAVFGGTGVRGTLIEKFSAIKKESSALEGRVILFFDDSLEFLKSAEGGGEGTLHEIKDILTMGSLPSIFAATPGSWKKMLELDPGLVGCFTPVYIEEANLEQTVKILKHLSGSYSVHHRVEIDADACCASASLSTRYIKGRRNPEKSLMVLDLASARTARMGQKKVTVETVSHVVSSLTGVPFERLSDSDFGVLMNMEEEISKRIVGHTEAIGRIALALRRNAAGFRGSRPIGSFLFLGPTGVGKTELAKAIAFQVLGSELSMVRLDMSEFSEPHSISRLIGSPPGYVGYEKGGELTEPLSEHPYRLILMDEFEKAHSAVWRLLLQILEEGRLTDSHGKVVDFSNSIVVLTSNIGSDIKVRSVAGFNVSDERESADYERKMMERAMEVFSPELFNRLDEVIVFSPLKESEVRQIALKLLGASADTIFSTRSVRLRWSGEVIDYLIGAGGYDPKLGARPMRRVIQSHIEGRVAELILSGKLKEGGSCYLEVKECGGHPQLKIRIRNRGGRYKSSQIGKGHSVVGKAIGFK